MNTLLIKGLNKLNLLPYFNISGAINLNGKVFKIPVHQGIGKTNVLMSRNEKWMLNLLKKILPQNNQLFIDVGVNVGQTLMRVKSILPDMPYIGFEPNPICVNYVSTLISDNAIKNASIVPVGISNTTQIGILNFFDNSATDPSASILSDFRSQGNIKRQTYIPLFDLQTIKQSINLANVSVLKIDVEGGELEVLQSFGQLITERKPIILIEILPVYNENNKYRLERQNEVELLLKNAGYAMYRISKDNTGNLKGLEKISTIGIHSDLSKCDYIMVPSDKKKFLSSFI